MKYTFLFIIVVLLVPLSCETARKEGKKEDHLVAIDSLINAMEVDLTQLKKEIGELAAFSSFLFEDRRSSNWATNEISTLKSTIFISSLCSDKGEVEREIKFTNPMDSVFEEVVSKFPLISQVYFNSRLQYSRLYPPYDPLSTLDKDLDITEFNFYYLADKERNPDKEAVWVEEVYIDPAGRGWILSLIHPVYKGEQMEGVLGIDITLTDLADKFLNNSEKKLLIIDENGTIVSGKSAAIEALSMPPLKNHTYIQTINSNSFRKEDFNLFKSKSNEVRKMASAFLVDKKDYFLVKSEIKKTYPAYCRKMNLLNWHLIELNF